jgi:hypothetical protein
MYNLAGRRENIPLKNFSVDEILMKLAMNSIMESTNY